MSVLSSCAVKTFICVCFQRESVVCMHVHHGYFIKGGSGPRFLSGLDPAFRIWDALSPDSRFWKRWRSQIVPAGGAAILCQPGYCEKSARFGSLGGFVRSSGRVGSLSGSGQGNARPQCGARRLGTRVTAGEGVKTMCQWKVPMGLGEGLWPKAHR